MTRGLLVSIAVAIVLAGCGGASKVKGSTTSTAGSRKPAPTMIVVPRPPAPPDQPCNGSPGYDIAAIELAEIRTDPVRVPTYEIAGRTVPRFVVPGVLIRAQRIPAQCASIDPAPAGCLGKVTIPAAEIPALTIPAVTVPGVSVPGASVAPVSQPAVTQPAVRQEGKVGEEVCAQKVQPGHYQPSVYQPSVYRPSVYRPSVYRPSVCVKGECIPEVNIPAFNVPAVNVPAVNVPSRVLPAKILPEIHSRCVKVFANSQTTAYQVCTDVLFAFDRANIRPAAEEVLRQVGRSIRKRYPDAAIQVDGHTDAKGSPDYNQTLSERRARAVANWLVRHAGISRSRLQVRGHGETQPVAPNTNSDGSDNLEGRRKNRRVVVGVTH